MWLFSLLPNAGSAAKRCGKLLITKAGSSCKQTFLFSRKREQSSELALFLVFFHKIHEVTKKIVSQEYCYVLWRMWNRE